MLVSDRGDLSKTVMVTVFAVLMASWALAATWYLAVSQTQYTQQAEQAATHYASDVDERIRNDCLYREPAGFVECAKEIIKSGQEAQTSEHDLAAQRSMALWAGAMFWATVAATVATAIGIFFVWLNLREARKATEAAIAAAKTAHDAVEVSRLTAQRELRAYINLKSAHIVIGPDEGTLTDLTLDIIFQNVGQTPAHGAEILVELTILGERRPSTQRTHGPVGPSGKLMIRESLFLPSRDVGWMIMEAPKISVWVAVRYRSIFDEAVALETICNVCNGAPFYKKASKKRQLPMGFHMIPEGPDNRST
jgi:uncharacterized protein (UPF0333 family)